MRESKMPANSIRINQDDIKRSEYILFARENVFDLKQVEYIKSLETLDLNAAPGSGKTTLLLAKLLILDTKMPFAENGGVLVLSHTNTAINEIECRVKPYCDNLFRFPNFIGTIQSFVNHYLAIPYYENKLHRKVVQVSDEYYELAVERYYNNCRNKSLLAWLNRQTNPLEFLKKLRFDDHFNLIEGPYGEADNFRLKNKSLQTYRSLKEMKSKILQSGILCYSDAYVLAKKYLSEFPYLKSIIATRFKYVFVDEMQDMDLTQYSLIEDIFNTNTCILQRLGDTNQAIFNGINKNNVEWSIRSNSITISNSNRLSKSCADIASKFSLSNVPIIGLNNSRGSIKPILYVYDEDLVECNVIKQFSNDLKNIYSSELSKNEELLVKAVAWRKESDDKKKISLRTYCPLYNQASSHVKDLDYIEVFNKENIELAVVYNWFLSLICDTLIRRQILLGQTNIYGMKILADLFMSSTNSKSYKIMLYNLCLYFINKEIELLKEEFRSLIFLIAKELEISMIDYDPSGIFNFTRCATNGESACNKCLVGKNIIVVTSVHSVKGETHDATLFMESFFNRKFESDLLYKVLLGEQVDSVIKKLQIQIDELNIQIEDLRGKRGLKSKVKLRDSKVNEMKNLKEYSKILYVAFSRPKTVVAYAISKSNYEKYKLKESSIDWNTVFINSVIE